MKTVKEAAMGRLGVVKIPQDPHSPPVLENQKNLGKPEKHGNGHVSFTEKSTVMENHHQKDCSNTEVGFRWNSP